MLSSYDFTGTKDVLTINNPAVVNDSGFLSPLSENLDATIINNFILSGNAVHIIAAGQFRYNFANVAPGDNDFINVALLDTETGGFKKIGNIGTFGIKAYEMVFELALSADKLIAVGDFDLVNTQLTGWSATSTLDYQTFGEVLSDFGPPFNNTITQGQLIKPIDWYTIWDSVLWPLTAAFSPTFSGNYVKNCAYYDNKDRKWHSLGLENFITTNQAVIGDGTYKYSYFNKDECGPYTLFTVATVGQNLYTAGNFFSGGLAKRDTNGNWSIVRNASGGYFGWPDPDGYFFGESYLYKVNKILFDDIDTIYIGGRFNDYTRQINPQNKRQYCMTSYKISNDTFYPMASAAGTIVPYNADFAQITGIEIPQVFDIALSGDLVCFGGNFYPGVRAYDRSRDVVIDLPALTAIVPLTSTDFNTNSAVLFYPATAFVTALNISPTLELVVGGTFTETSSSYFCSIGVYSTTDQAYNTVIFNTSIFPKGIFSLLDPKAQISTMYNHYNTYYDRNATTIIMTPRALYNNEFFSSGTGVKVYGNSPYHGVSGIAIY
jgi:hypothetical protein